MNATLCDPETGELLAEIEFYPAGSAPEGVGTWRYSFTVIEEHVTLQKGMVTTINLEEGRVGRAIVESLIFRSDQLRRTGTLLGAAPLE